MNSEEEGRTGLEPINIFIRVKPLTKQEKKSKEVIVLILSLDLLIRKPIAWASLRNGQLYGLVLILWKSGLL